MDSVHLTEAQIRKLVAFHIRNLRKVMKIEHAYYSRISNDRVIEMANIAMNKGNISLTWQQFLQINAEAAKTKIEKVSQIILKRQERLMGHIIRLDGNDPMRQAAITNELRRPAKPWKRVGKPREHWTETTLDRICRTHYGTAFNVEDADQVQAIITLAEQKYV